MLGGGLAALSLVLAFGRLPAEADAATRRGFYRQAWFAGAGMAILPLLVWNAGDRPVTEFAAQGWFGAWPAATLAFAGAWTVGLAVALHRILSGAAYSRLHAVYSRFRAIMPTTRKELHASWGAAVSAGIGEEIAYRGFLLWYLSNVLGLAGALIATSLLFGAAHGYQRGRGIIFAAGAGLVLGCALLISGSLLLVAWMHATYNIASFTAGWKVLRSGAPSNRAPEPAAR